MALFPMAGNAIDKKCFTFSWKLENISYCKQQKGERIESPAFVVDGIERTNWKLHLYPKGSRDENYIGYFLYRDADSRGPEMVEIIYELAFIAKDGSVLASQNSLKEQFSKGECMGYNYFHKREDVYILRRAEFLPQDTLTVRCRMWKSAGEMPEDIYCAAHTRIGVEKVYFLWNLENFSTFELEKKSTYQVKSIETDTLLLSIDLSLKGGLVSGEIIRFKLSLPHQTITFGSLQLSLVNASGNRVKCNQDEFGFGSRNSTKLFTFHFTKNKLLSKKSVYLPNDVLSLHWEWAFSKGIVLEEIREVRYGFISSENKILGDEQVNNGKVLPLSNALKSLLDKEVLCDVELKTNTSIFPAHKVMLTAASSVFYAMFTNEMKEKNRGSVNIEDLSDDAVGRMLLYIYTARVEDLTWESASHLYEAADKYEILSLKKICSSYLKNNLSPNSACEVLLLSDFHADENLKSFVQDYILKNIEEIVNSDEWELLMENNGKLAAETVCLQYKQK